MYNNINWVIYARKSTESSDRQIQSIDDQVKIQKEVASRLGLNVVKIIFESKSAKAPYVRDGFKELTSLIENGKVNGILTWKMDRLFRNPVDGGFIQYALQQKKLLCIKTPEKDYLPEDNAIILSVESGMSSQYIRDLSVNVRRGVRSKAEKGWFPNIPPIGYLNSKLRDKGNETILVDEERFSIVRKMWDLMLTGTYSPPEVLRIATNEWGLTTPIRRTLGGKAVSVSYIYKILTSEFYTGTFTYAGKVYQGKHIPMITRDEFDRVQMLLGKKGKPRSQTHTFSFTGIMRCGECGAVITASEKKKYVKSLNKTNTYIYYHCTKRKKYQKCNQAPIKVENLESQVLKLINQNIISKDFYDISIKVLKEMHETEIETRQTIYKNQLTTVQEIQKKLDRAVTFLMNGTVTEEQYKSQKKDLEEALVRQTASLKETEKRAQNWTELTENVFHFAKAASSAFTNGDDQTKKEILAHLGWNHQIKSKEVLIDLCSWFSVLKNGELEISEQIKRLELDKTLTPERRKEAFASIHTSLCVGQDLNLRSPKGDRFTVCCD